MHACWSCKQAWTPPTKPLSGAISAPHKVTDIRVNGDTKDQGGPSLL